MGSLRYLSYTTDCTEKPPKGMSWNELNNMY